MKKALSVILALTMVMCIGIPTAFAAGTDYYIDSVSGSDANSGKSPGDAWASAQMLESVTLGAGDSVLFKAGGVYTCTLTLTCSGTPESPVTIASYGEGAAPVLTTNEKTEVLKLFDCSYVTVRDLEITAHNGGGIWIDTLEKTSVGITVNNVTFHDIQNYKVNNRDNLSWGAAAARACIMVKGLPARSRFAVNDLVITGCEMYDCGNGISVWGSWNDEQKPWCEKEEDIDPVYNTGLYIADCYFHDMDAEALIVGMCDGALVTDCRSINCCQGEGTDENGKVLYYIAAMWFWGSENSTIQYCEIAGQKNVGDGMAVDFDSHSNNCTYQYIYSHDNTRFMCNCPNYSGHHGNTVRYCLSVNDNRGRTTVAGGAGEYNFSFYNDTVVNCADFHLVDIHDSLVANNIIVPASGHYIVYDSAEAFTNNNTYKNNCYYNCDSPLTDALSQNINPGFSGENTADKDSFMLSKDSPLIGAGLKIDDGMTDFYGNTTESRNIGCYCGEGTDSEYVSEEPNETVMRYIMSFIIRIIHELKGLFD